MARYMFLNPATLVVTDSKLFARTGDIGRWNQRVAVNFERYAKERAPVSKRPNTSHGGAPGNLKRSLETASTRVGVRHYLVTLSGPDYMKYVVGGTTGPIVPVSKRHLVLPPNPGFGTKMLHSSVAGQRANPFLRFAMARLARRHPSIPSDFRDRAFRRG